MFQACICQIGVEFSHTLLLNTDSKSYMSPNLLLEFTLSDLELKNNFNSGTSPAVNTQIVKVHQPLFFKVLK